MPPVVVMLTDVQVDTAFRVSEPFSVKEGAEEPVTVDPEPVAIAPV